MKFWLCLLCLWQTVSVANAMAGTRVSDDQVALQLMKLQRTPSGSTEMRKVANGIADFGFEHHVRWTLQGSTKNIVTSPFSLATAMILAANGAEGRTLTEMLKSLGVSDLSTEALNDGYASAAALLRAAAGGNRLTFANAIFADKGYDIQPDYQKRVKRSLDAEVSLLDFSDSDRALEAINDYIAAHTGGKIPHLLDVLPRRASMVNAGHFDGVWAIPFNPRYTHSAPFRTSTGNKSVPTMLQPEIVVPVLPTADFTLASLAYDQAELALDLLIPKVAADESPETALQKVASQLTGPNYRRWIAEEHPMTSYLLLPKLTMNFKADVLPALHQTMPQAFGPAAEFGRLSSAGFEIESIMHAVTLEVDEKGSRGGFATAFGGRSLPFTVQADHPFILVIRHTRTGIPLFVATVRAPEAPGSSRN